MRVSETSIHRMCWGGGRVGQGGIKNADSWTSHMETWVKGGRNWEKLYYLLNPSLLHTNVLMSNKGQGLWFTELAVESWWLVYLEGERGSRGPITLPHSE